ncbi:RCC1/BLIP-II [Hypoxylon fuscum]|nr:RCC1/BLIP-II [Hypoxylon fuscum]
MELYVTGLNAWRQLVFDQEERPPSDSHGGEPNDIVPFQLALQADFIGRPYACNACTIVSTSSGIRMAGFIKETPDENTKQKLLASTAALASNDTVVEYTGNGIIVQRPSPPGLGQVPANQQSFSGMGNIVQLVACMTSFAALSDDGRVWTWGDGRFGALFGRPVSPESPAERPGLVEALQDLPTGKITQIRAGGWMFLALTEGQDLYAWGGYPGETPPLEGLSDEPMPVVVEDSDIVDCGVGNQHIIVLNSEGDVYVIGNNDCGQLGMEVTEAKTWTKVPLNIAEGNVVCGVVAGWLTSFILTKPRVS